ncbi:MAG: hypothetical protein R3C12_17095 [Planctomycetaceae bacterium]
MLFKSEAIVHPDDVVRYVDPRECQISYNPTLMALLWEALATRDTKLLRQSLGHRQRLPPGTIWTNYLRCHDDIGWTFDDLDAAAVGINGYDHRQFLNQFYTGQFEGSFARGVPFQHNPATGDMRISGTLASLAGLEQAIDVGNEQLIDQAVCRIILLHGMILSIGGIPLLYLGEEWGMLNDYDFVKDPAKAGDTRWIHRPKMRWDYLEELESSEHSGEGSLRKRIFTSIQQLIALRKQLPAIAGLQMELIPLKNTHVLGFLQPSGRPVDGPRELFGTPQQVEGNTLRTAGLGRFFFDRISQREFNTSENITLEPYQVAWLVRS